MHNILHIAYRSAWPGKVESCKRNNSAEVMVERIDGEQASKVFSMVRYTVILSSHELIVVSLRQFRRSAHPGNQPGRPGDNRSLPRAAAP